MSKPNVLFLVLDFVKKHPNCRPREIVSHVEPYGHSQESIRQAIWRAKNSTKHLSVNEDGRYSITPAGENRLGGMVVVDKEEVKRMVADTKQDPPASHEDGAYALLRQVAQLRKKMGKREFDSAYQVLKVLDP